MTNRSSRAAAALVLLLCGAAFAIPGCSTSEPRPESATDASARKSPVVEHGLRLFAKHCALCHGDRGDGRGSAAEYLFPAPRDFTSGQFLLVSTPSGAPNDADEPLYLAQDTHWTDRGLQVVAGLIAERIRRYPWFSQVADPPIAYRTQPAPFTHRGDLPDRLAARDQNPLELLGELGIRHDLPVDLELALRVDADHQRLL